MENGIVIHNNLLAAGTGAYHEIQMSSDHPYQIVQSSSFEGKLLSLSLLFSDILQLPYLEGNLLKDLSCSMLQSHLSFIEINSSQRKLVKN